MLSIHALSPTQFHVTGAPGRGDYVLKIPPALHRGFGAAGEDRLWFLIAERGQDSHIDIFDAATGACVGSLNVPVYTETKNILISRDGRRMFLDLRLNGYGQAPGPLSIIDLGAASVIRTFELPRGFGVPLFERDDGKLIIQAGKTIPNFTGVGGVSMMLVDPLKGIIAEESADGLGLLHPSADGKYWLRPDATSFPSRYVVQNGVPTRYFGLTVQLWEAFPLRFRRRIVVAWLPLNRLPGMANYPHPESTPYGKAYDVISTLLETLKLKVTERLARAHFPEFYRTNDSLWHAASQCLQVFSASQFRASWEPSGKAFWVDLYPGCFVRADIEGRISPQLMLPPSLRQPQEIHNVPVRVEGLAGGRARLEFKHGTAVIAPPKGADDVFRIVTLGEHG
jgi:hypothetical protein